MVYMPRKCAKCEITFHGGDMYDVLGVLLCQPCTIRGLIAAVGTFGFLRALGLEALAIGQTATVTGTSGTVATPTEERTDG